MSEYLKTSLQYLNYGTSSITTATTKQADKSNNISKIIYQTMYTSMVSAQKTRFKRIHNNSKSICNRLVHRRINRIHYFNALRIFWAECIVTLIGLLGMV